MTKTSYYQEQTIGGVVEIINNLRIRDMNKEILQNWEKHKELLNSQDVRFIDALKEVNKIRNFLGSPENILGSDLTKHGEIAENVEVHISNARAVLEGKEKYATFDGVGRTAPEDYLKHGIEIQSKFYNGARNTLDGILKHMDKYDNFGRDGSYYEIPKDQFEVIKQVFEGGNTEGLSDKTINTILKKIHEIEQVSGRPFPDVVHPGISNYSEVQQGVALKTIDGYQQELCIRNGEIKDSIYHQEEKSKIKIEISHQPSIEEAVKIAGIGALIGGGFSAGLNIYNKYRNGKKIQEFSAADWKSIGVDFGAAAVKGAITGAAVYGITNYTGVGAPVASAFVSATFGVKKLADSYKNGEISQSEFINSGQLLCLDTGAVALGATAGQVLIPVPIVGALLGTFAAKAFMSISKNYLGDEEKNIQLTLDNEYSTAISRFDIHNQNLINQIIYDYEKIGGVTEAAFNMDLNYRIETLNASIKLANMNNVDRERLLVTIDEADNYFLN